MSHLYERDPERGEDDEGVRETVCYSVETNSSIQLNSENNEYYQQLNQ